jgi:hypothetical protein
LLYNSTILSYDIDVNVYLSDLTYYINKNSAFRFYFFFIMLIQSGLPPFLLFWYKISLLFFLVEAKFPFFSFSLFFLIFFLTLGSFIYIRFLKILWTKVDWSFFFVVGFGLRFMFFLFLFPFLENHLFFWVFDSFFCYRWLVF